MTVKVSVSIITYNHEPYIAQAIESALDQQVDFDYEIVIGEDDSTDGTRAIVKKYAQSYPQRIRLLLNDRSNVIYIDGRPTGRWNLVNNLRQARGQYIARLDGDDCWTSPHKLKRQVDFLDQHEDCVLCFHRVKRISEGTNSPRQSVTRNLSKPFYTLEDLLQDNFIASCSVMFRNGLIEEFPDWYYSVAMGDWPLYILLAQHGPIGYIDATMAAHRVHSGGLWTSRNQVGRLQDHIIVLQAFKSHLGSEYHDRLNNTIARRHMLILHTYARTGDLKSFGTHVRKLCCQQEIPRRSLVKSMLWMARYDVTAIARQIARLCIHQRHRAC